MYTLLLIINVICAIVMVVMILLQHGQGADMGSSFGRGSQGSLLGVTGSANFLSRTTSILATIFFTTALALSFVSRTVETDNVLEELTTAVEPIALPAAAAEVPVVPAPRAEK